MSHLPPASRLTYGPGSTCTRLALTKVQKGPCSLNMWCHYLVTDWCFWSLYRKVGDYYLHSSSNSSKPLFSWPQVDPKVFKGPGACFPTPFMSCSSPVKFQHWTGNSNCVHEENYNQLIIQVKEKMWAWRSLEILRNLKYITQVNPWHR